MRNLALQFIDKTAYLGTINKIFFTPLKFVWNFILQSRSRNKHSIYLIQRSLRYRRTTDLLSHLCSKAQSCRRTGCRSISQLYIHANLDIILLVRFTGWYRTTRLTQCGQNLTYYASASELIIHDSSIRSLWQITSETSSSESGKTWRKNYSEICPWSTSFHTWGFLTCLKTYDMGPTA
jgi:hypothetical protein